MYLFACTSFLFLFLFLDSQVNFSAATAHFRYMHWLLRYILFSNGLVYVITQVDMTWVTCINLADFVYRNSV